MLWLCVNTSKGSKYPAWKRSIAIDREGTVFVAAAVGGREKEVSLSTLSDRTKILVCFDHVYVPMCWLVDKFPVAKAYCRAAACSALEHIERVLACRDTWCQVRLFWGPAGEKHFLSYSQ